MQRFSRPRPGGSAGWRCRRRRRPVPPGFHRQTQQPNQEKGAQPVAVVSMRELLEAGVHFGHQTRRWNPKMKRFIFGERGGIYIIDLQQTLERLEEAAAFARNLAERGGSVLDRKSTRLNSSHSQISYAVFCLKKKKRRRSTQRRCRQCSRCV